MAPAAFLPLFLALAAPVRAGTIVGSVHDLDAASALHFHKWGYDPLEEICVYCHTPHQANTDVAMSGVPLWNRPTPSSVYTVYGSPTMDTSPGQPGAVSLACLSCHDGTIAVDATINRPGSGLNQAGPWHGNSGSTSPQHFPIGITAGDSCGECHVDGSATGAHGFEPVYLSTDLADDHPIGMTYPTSAEDAAFNAPPDLLSGWTSMPLYGGKVECSSCHAVHDPDIVPFLRVTSSGSQLCLVCHVK